MTVTGGVDMTWMSLKMAEILVDTGNPIGIGSNLTFTKVQANLITDGLSVLQCSHAQQ